MPGIMFGAALKGLGDGMDSLGTSGMQYADLADRKAMQEQLLRERLAAGRDSSGARFDATSAKTGADGGTKGVIPFGAGTDGELALATQARMTLPEYRKWLAYRKTGDTSGYESEAPYVPEATQEEMNQQQHYISPQVKKYLDDKTRVLGELMQQFQQGEAYDDNVKGRLGMQQFGIMADMRAGTLKPADAARMEGALKGDAMTDNLGESGTFDRYGNDQRLNELGGAKAADERASAKTRAATVRSDGVQSPPIAPTAAQQAVPSQSLDGKPWDRFKKTASAPSPAVVATETAQPSAATSSSLLAQAPPLTAAMEKRIRAEQEAMGMGTRLQYSPEVKAALEGVQRQIDAQRLRESQEYRQAELERARRGWH